MKILIKLIVLIIFPSLVLISYNNCGKDGFRAVQSVNDPPFIRNSLGISINNNDGYTKDLDVILSLKPQSTTANEMFISFDSNCSQGSWETLKTNKLIYHLRLDY